MLSFIVLFRFVNCCFYL